MSSKPTIRILGISGSLKANSSNSLILRELASFADSDIQFSIYDGLGNLPHFNPDNEAGDETVKHFKQQLKEADGIVICTPEYAFGVPGVLKNALDWTVSTGDLNEKPVIAISASPLYAGGNKALASLILTLGALGTKTDTQSWLSIGDVANKTDKQNGVIDVFAKNELQDIFEHLVETIQTTKLKS